MSEPEMLNDRGVALRRQGAAGEAVAAFDQAIALNPNYADAHNNRGNALRDLGRFVESETAYRRAIAIAPNLWNAHANLGNVLLDQGRFADAIAEYRASLQINPQNLAGLNHLANVLRITGNLQEAESLCRQALRLKPDLADSHINLGNILFDQERFDEARQAIETAIKLRPDDPIAYNNLGLALAAVGRTEDAIAAARKAVALRPDYADGFNSLGNLLADEGRYGDAADAFRRALQLAPNFAIAHWNYAAIPLLRGDFQTGWAEQEWRKQTHIPSAPRRFPQPQWTGQDLHGKTILLHTEQGFGDTIQFIRYVPLVIARGARVILSCPNELASLLGESFPQVQIASDSLPNFDFHCPLLSLPYVFQTRLNTIPTEVPYLKPPADRIERWKGLMKARPEKLRVGLAWAGNPKRKLNRRRSIHPRELLPITSIKTADFYSLQIGGDPAPLELGLIDLTSYISDFSDTAAFIHYLDLVVCVDTAIAHLAGALAKPVWVLLGFVPAWRWMLDRFDSPWYPTTRLFRQQAMDDWSEPIARAAAALQMLSGE